MQAALLERARLIAFGILQNANLTVDTIAMTQRAFRCLLLWQYECMDLCGGRTA